MWNVKFVTMYEQRNLPVEESRFLKHPMDEKFFSVDALLKNFVVPYTIYFLWAGTYYYINFVV